ncbi:MAG TPA: cupin domain-containing protein [Gemmatimonadaceae bacterium]|nr:cupin domain-containing protein [Gemmatimonadaceae bacterium]
MAHAGAVIENPVVGDRIVFLRTTADTAGELLEFDLFARAGAQGPPEHVHPQATERFEVVQGVLRARVAGVEKTVEVGESLVIPPGTLHSWWNSGAAEVQVRVQLTPAGRNETFLETIYALASSGRTNSKGIPGFLQLSVFAPSYFDTNHIVRPPLFVQRVVLGMIAPLARLLGYQPDCPYPYKADTTSVRH